MKGEDWVKEEGNRAGWEGVERRMEARVREEKEGRDE